MGDGKNVLPPSKKRVAGRQLSRDDDPDAEEDVCDETGTFQKATDEVLATRRIVKVRRNASASTGAANPFAGIQLVPPPSASAAGESTTKVPETTLPRGVIRQSCDAQEEQAVKSNEDANDGKNENEATSGPEMKTTDAFLSEAKEDCDTKATDGSVNDEDSKSKGEAQPLLTEAAKENGDGEKDDERELNETAKEENSVEADKKVTSTPEPPVAVNCFQQLSSTQNAFAGISGTGFSSTFFSFGVLPKPGTTPSVSFSSALTGTGPLFGTKASGNEGSSHVNATNGASTRVFGVPATENATTISGSGVPALQEVPVETGEEKEKAVFVADAVLFEYISGGWKERGKGELKVNVSTTDTGKARLVMRSKGNYRLILNANLFPDMKLANMDKRGVTFVCMNSAGEAKEGLSTFALKFKDGSMVENFRGAVEANKGSSSGGLKTPENSPKASEF
uniref:RanBD1 domain-containing protein n=1 Tax=Araucaria cunninghamii TaxID=56994 RepID=A0A0D6QUU4_ARACU